MPTGEGAPPRITPKSLDDYLEVQTKAVFQSGMSWKVVEAKWTSTREALDDFQVAAIASYGPEKLAELGDDARVIRNKRKLAAITGNARRMIELDEQFNGFQSYLRSFDDFYLLMEDIRKQFKFMGPMGVYYWMWVVGEDVPPYEEFSARTKK